MRITVFAILSAAVLLTASAQFVSFPEFKCGTNKITTAIAYRTAKATCPTQLEEINECCRDHDECYDDQFGRKFCDSTFCGCLQNTMTSYDEKCDPTLKNMCMAVKLFGEAAYKRATVRRKRAAGNKSADLDRTYG
ncbi:hypothetical protein QR680_003984 [Steinernema hermaphroditum]|uniref:Phospholipase A2 n=1 Tax=Steinernema hermaphroditum TaxID=289476 RepID=A0AA39LSH6_9BILA|nr:hypothetical protein QR680_003984 [Steinernema hermaphroditum]